MANVDGPGYMGALAVGVVLTRMALQLMRPPLEMVTEMLGVLQMLVWTRMALQVHGKVTAKANPWSDNWDESETWVGNSS